MIHKYIVDFFKFYLKPFIIIIGLNVLLYILLGSYLESYESVFTTFLQGIYTKPCTRFIDINNHFLIMKVYEYLSAWFPTLQVYGIVLFIYNWICLTILGLVLYRVIKINAGKSSILLFVILYSILSVDNIVNLSSARITFILFTSIYGFIESRRLEQKQFKTYHWIVFTIITFFAVLTRMEAVMLASLIYIGVLIVYKRFYTFSLMPLVLSLFIFMAFNFIITVYSSEAKKVFIYKEKEIIDRKNFMYEELPSNRKLDLQAFIQYGIMDKEHFTLAFYNSISISNSKVGTKGLLDRVRKNAYYNTFMHSLEESYTSVYVLLFYFITGLYVLFKRISNRKKFLRYFLLIVISPFIICLNTIVPLRFLIPFYTVFGCFNVMIYIKYSAQKNTLLSFCLIVFACIFYNAFTARADYLRTDKSFDETTKRLESLIKKYNPQAPVIINMIDFTKFFPVNPLKHIPKQHVLFLNFFYFEAYDHYFEAWNEVCHCNPLSLTEKIDYIVSSGNLILIEDNSFEFMHNYLETKYHIELIKTDIGLFDGDLKISQLSYEK